jgi:hypothetical protein
VSRFPTEAERTRRADLDSALDALDWTGVMFDSQGVEGLPKGVSGGLNLCRSRTSVVLHPLHFTCRVSIDVGIYDVKVPWASLHLIANARTREVLHVYMEVV